MSLLYRQLADLLAPQKPRFVGTVIAVDDGGCTVELLGGGTVHVLGEATVSQQVFFRDGVIEGPAPTMTLLSIEV